MQAGRVHPQHRSTSVFSFASQEDVVVGLRCMTPTPLQLPYQSFGLLKLCIDVQLKWYVKTHTLGILSCLFCFTFLSLMKKKKMTIKRNKRTNASNYSLYAYAKFELATCLVYLP